MRIFLDECVDWRLSRDLTGHEVRTAHQMAWTALKNGELLARAARAFDVFPTTDRNLSCQQNLQEFSIAVVVLCAASNRIVELRDLLPELEAALPTARAGQALLIGEEP